MAQVMRWMAAAATASAAMVSGAAAQVTIPNECESATSKLAPLSAYFGGVASFGTEIVPTTIHSGNALRCWANFRRDAIFTSAGFTVGVNSITTPALSVPAGATVFSLTVQTPDLAGKQIRLKVTIREDDDANGIIDAVEEDDEWEHITILSAQGTQVLNIPLATMADNNPGVGNDTRQFATTSRMAVNITFETRRNLPGGIIEVPTSFLIDHVGFFEVAQTIPTPCRADFDGANGLQPADIFEFLNAWFAGDARADFDAVGGILPADIFEFLNAWFAGCP